MAGFLSGLFGGKKKDEASVQPEVRTPRENGQAYYLDADDAKSYGNVDYMRTAKKVRRTFPKTVNNQEIELEREVSSMTMSNGKLGTQVPKVSIGSTVISSTSTSNGSVNGSVPTDAEVAQRRKSDSSLDMFRSMAKDIRK
ncbi:MAG: hypothetical protein NW224_18445 [Leptolyngbyaceae cyanobacterium bins.302]|nr:hypothetical protein [Leptolyngbyaceae cyanobacterium bins.302]